MSERTTIGGTVYESIGSSKSNLLLKCNGTARILWGNKLIDLIKNGKLASDTDSSNLIFIISDENDISQDGIYVLSNEDENKLFIYKDNQKYDLTKTDLYISASTKLDITVELLKLALENIGMYYETLEDVQKAGIQNGIVYIISTKELYTIKDGDIAEFEAKLKTITVEEVDEGEIIDSAVKIVLSVAEEEYMLLEDSQITVLKDMKIAPDAVFGSEGSSQEFGYRLYIQENLSYLEVDNISVRNGFPIEEYIETTYSLLKADMELGNLEALEWYLITDYANPWKLTSSNYNKRPIIVRAASSSLLYEKGYLWNNHLVEITYDPYYNDLVTLVGTTTEDVTALGRITWMRDSNNNLANFDFLDYRDVDNNPLGTLHTFVDDGIFDRSIFPIGSYNNTIIVSDLGGISIVNKLPSTSSNKIDFLIKDSIDENAEEGITETLYSMIMHDNFINCSSFIVTSSCSELIYSTFKNTSNVNIQASIKYSDFDNLQNITIIKSITNSLFGNVNSCTFNALFDDVYFKNLTSCTFGEGTLKNIKCRSDLSNLSVDSTGMPLLYDTSKYKLLYYDGSELQINEGILPPPTFTRGMIIMHSGIEPIPEGWAICDGNNGTPNLIGRFIKAVGTSEEVKSVDVHTNNEVQLLKENLPSYIGEAGDHVFASDAYTSFLLVSGKVTDRDVEWFENTPIKIEPNYYALIFIMKL